MVLTIRSSLSIRLFFYIFIGLLMACCYDSYSKLYLILKEYQPKQNARRCFNDIDTCITHIEEITHEKVHLVSFQRKVKTTRNSRLRQRYVVPNIVHAIRFGSNQPFAFYNYISVKSIDKYIEPLALFLWGDGLPSVKNKWWNKTINEIGNIYHVPVSPRRTIGGKEIEYKAHSADILRLFILNELGGIYLDNDVIVLKSFSDLRLYPMTVGRETNTTVSNAILISEPRSEFISLWISSYGSYDPGVWGENSVNVASHLTRMFPQYVHEETTKLAAPNWQTVEALYRNNVDITPKYAIHLYFKYLRYLPTSEEELSIYDCTVGQAMRKVLYDSTGVRASHNRTFGYIRSRLWAKERWDGKPGV